ncbi:hypothetical protein [Dyella caseinilytica]|uniref:Cell division protein FtsL n=1 Tax=Dyella caseinilytica TaxID=1849581 RepID=A0ABX7GXN9_9GAMM|nr:hypothetical protein [Dyella caseinilytica]QRN55221.1 hypothetical protein ISN74_07795 [Dyella caseinilytica]GGA00193.1 hypothetical protein GCM10011408_21340 [Dyella caseinilytica]
MCLAALADYDRETQRQICALELMLAERRRRQLLLDEGIRARANRFMPTAVVEVLPPSPGTEAIAVGAHQEKAA